MQSAAYSAPWATGLSALRYGESLYARVFPDDSRPSDGLSARVHQYLWTRIVNRELLPGARFYEADIATQTGVSRVPVREAIARLSDDGLLVRAGRGIQLRQFEEGDVVSLYNFRGVLECHAALIAAETLQPDALASALARQRALATQMRAPDPHYVVSYLVDDLALHAMLVGACANQHLTGALHRIRGMLSLFQTDGMLREEDVQSSLTEHVVILEALARHDGPGAADAVRAHIANARDRIVRAMNIPRTFYCGETGQIRSHSSNKAVVTTPPGASLRRFDPVRGARLPPAVSRTATTTHDA